MTTSPELWIVAGPNGAGKTTCVQTEPISKIIPNVHFFNPDDLTKQLLIAEGYSGFADAPEHFQLRCFREAASRVERELSEAIERGESVGVETVLSTEKYKAVVNRVRQLGHSVHLIYVTLDSPTVAIERVRLRVSRGGHDVPAEKIVDRFHRSHSNLAWFAYHANHFWIIDNSGDNPTIPPKLCAYGGNGRVEFLDPDSPDQIRSAFVSPLFDGADST